jgi:DNA (cytosine-5)-methyltransferase 1
MSWLHEDGALARSLRVAPPVAGSDADDPDILLPEGIAALDARTGGAVSSPFLDAGVMWDRRVWTRSVQPKFRGRRRTLGDILLPAENVPPHFFIPKRDVARWRYLKGAKREERQAATGFRYVYSEGAIPFPDPLNQPSRTILTGEGGATPSRFKHVVPAERRRLRRLTPVELERLNGFQEGWTETGMTEARRAFMMGNAIVTGVVRRIGHVLAQDEFVGS